jgi:hypothetical protein
MAGGQYLCPVCHQPFEVIGAKKAHVEESHSEAAELYGSGSFSSLEQKQGPC